MKPLGKIFILMCLLGVVTLYSCNDAEVNSSAIGTDILSFDLENETGPANIDNTNHRVESEVVFLTYLNELAPTFTLSEGATSVPESGTIGDYSSEVTIMVTAQDGSNTQDWTASVTRAPNSLADILLFSIPEAVNQGVIDWSNNTVDIKVPVGTDRTDLTPEFLISFGATSNPASGTAGDYSSPVTISVSAQDGSMEDWAVTVSEPPSGASNETDILTFSIPEESRDAWIEGDLHQITSEVILGTDLTSLIATWTLSPGATSVPVSQSTSDYSSIVEIEVTAEDGTTQQVWSVRVVFNGDALEACDREACRFSPALKQRCIDLFTQCLFETPAEKDNECFALALQACSPS